jgi:hypothetical protein
MSFNRKITPLAQDSMEMSKISDATDDLEGSKRYEGGDEAEAIENEMQDETTKFLCQIPPDWEAAEKHAEANLVLDAAATELNLDDKSTYCICC